MGTPDFAVPSLKALINSNHQIVAVYTKEPKPAGRGYSEVKSAIHQLADQHGLQVITPKNFKLDADVEQFKNLGADIAVVAAYGLILPQSILSIPKYGCINLHPSKLPRWRGAAPIQRTILAGDPDTDICIMQMDVGMDTGDILVRQNFTIPGNMTSKELHDECAQIGGDLFLQTLQQIEQGVATPIKQSEDGVLHATKISREEELINWNRSAFEIHCQIRAFAPRPGAYFELNGEKIKILAADYIMDSHDYAPGTVMDEALTIACNGGFLKPQLLQREGRKMIYVDAFLRGFPIQTMQKLGV